MLHQQRQDHKERLLALDRVMRSNAFGSSESLQRILKFLVEKSLTDSAGDIKEYSIATEALGRPQDFDPRADNIVRMQMQRLRRKLDEYYNEEGAKDPVRIVIPHGHYNPEFHAAPNNGNSEPAPPSSSPLPVQRTAPGANKILLWGLPWVLALTISVIFLIVSPRLPRASRRPTTPNFGESAALPDPMSALWKPFLLPSTPPLIVYSNAFLMMNDAGDLYRYFINSGNPLPAGAKVPNLSGLDRRSPIPQGAGRLYYFDLYTGTGEVIAAARIAQLLAEHNQEFSIKRSRAVFFDDLHNNNVIFIGASLEDSVLRELPVETDLSFEQKSMSEFMGSQQIRDRHPAPGQPETYSLMRNANTGTLEGEYALISLLPGATPARYVMILGGISTIGTQAAVEFATAPDSMALLDKMRSSAAKPSTHSPYFQALLKVAIRDGAAAKTECVFVRELHRN
jgi:hypothetical protein